MNAPTKSVRQRLSKPGFGLLGIVILFLTLSWAVTSSEHPDGLTSLYDFKAQPARQWQLPKALNEISGLAMNSNGQLFAHNDETATLYQIDWEGGEFVKIFSMGAPTIKDDFEGLAIIGERFYLITSSGLIYQSIEGGNGEHTAYNRYDTGLSQACEVEGLASDVENNSLFILCKNVFDKTLKNKLVIYSWDVVTGEKPTAPLIQTDLKNSDLPDFIQDMAPTALEVLPDGSGFLIASSKGHVLLEIDTQGKITGWFRLKQSRHPQTEGITFSPNSTLIISDEGKRGILTLYEQQSIVTEQ